MMKIYINEDRMWEPAKVRMRLREEESEIEKGK